MYIPDSLKILSNSPAWPANVNYRQETSYSELARTKNISYSFFQGNVKHNYEVNVYKDSLKQTSVQMTTS